MFIKKGKDMAKFDYPTPHTELGEVPDALDAAHQIWMGKVADVVTGAASVAIRHFPGSPDQDHSVAETGRPLTAPEPIAAPVGEIQQ